MSHSKPINDNVPIEQLAYEYVQLVMTGDKSNVEFHLRQRMQKRCGNEYTIKHIANALRIHMMVFGETPNLNNFDMFSILTGK